MTTLPCSQCECAAFVGASEARFCSDCGHSRAEHGEPGGTSTGNPTGATGAAVTDPRREAVVVGAPSAPGSPNGRRLRPWQLGAVSLVLIGAVGVLGVALLRGGGPTASGTTPEATSTAELLLEDGRAPAGITNVSCKENTDDFATSGLSPYRCEVAAEDGAFLCDAGETLSEGFQLECDEASHYEAVKADSLALAQRALDALNQDDYWSTYVAALASHATYAEPFDGRAICSLHRALRDGLLEDDVSVNLYSPVASTGAGLGTVLTVAPDGQIRDSPYQGSNLGDHGIRLDPELSWGIGTCPHGDLGLTLGGVLIRPATTASVELADAPTRQSEAQQVVAAAGTPVPADALDAYEEGKAVGVEIRDAIAAGLTGTYAEGDRGPQRYFEDTRDERNPYPDRSDDLQNYWYELGSWEQSGLYDGPGQVVLEGEQETAPKTAPSEPEPVGGCIELVNCAKSGGPYIPDNWMGGGYSPRPELIGLGSSSALLDLSWSGWGSDRAVAKGVSRKSDCKPSCAQGTVSKVPVTIVASDLGNCFGWRFYRSIAIETRGETVQYRVKPFQSQYDKSFGCGATAIP